MAELTVKIGKKPSSGKQKPDESKMTKGKKPEIEGEVSGQYIDAYSCPYCWAVNWIDVSPVYYYDYMCWNCGNWFTA